MLQHPAKGASTRAWLALPNVGIHKVFSHSLIFTESRSEGRLDLSRRRTLLRISGRLVVKLGGLRPTTL